MIESVSIYIQMELCNHTLEDYLQKRNQKRSKESRTLTNEEMNSALRIGQEIVEGLKFIHSQDLIHRDLKPSNIMMSEDNQGIKIGDFGLVTQLIQNSQFHTESTLSTRDTSVPGSEHSSLEA